MFFGFFGKKEVKRVEEDTKKSFESVKKDINSVGEWIKHLSSEKDLQKKDISDLKDLLSSVQNELEGLKNIVSIMNELKPNKGFMKNKQLSKHQTPVYAVQTAVQTPNFNQFSITERAILWILLNSDLKLSYDDLAAILGKERSTIRGQLNSIKQKSEGLIEEIVEKNGKKRVFIHKELKEQMLKKSKVRVNLAKNSKKAQELKEKV
ncbi:MAG: hypothetical protein KJ566_01525 [Nanoarchaeota archaeon]|nr:hypothetical protein [Nanoarchaeota archaeon]